MASAKHSSLVSLIATMRMVDRELIIKPQGSESPSETPELLAGSSIPTEPEEFNKYFVTSPATNSNFLSVHCWLQTTIQIPQIKRDPLVWHHLSTHGVWLDKHEIKSTNITRLGWLYELHPDHISLHALTTKVATLLPPEIMQVIEFQVRTVPYLPAHRDFTTRAFVLHIARENKNEYADKIFKTLNPSSDMMLVPFNSRADVDNQIRNLFEQQNMFLQNTVTIRIDNLKNIDETILNSDGGTITVNLQLMGCKGTKNQDLFLSLSRCMRMNRDVSTWKEES